MRIFSTGEAAKRIGVTRDSLISALRNGAPDTSSRIGGRRVFNEADVDALAAWYKTREMMRNGIMRAYDREERHACPA